MEIIQSNSLIGPSASLPVSSISWVRWFKANAITPVSDGTAISSWADSAGSGDPAVQAAGANQPVYKVAANGINGVPVVRFNGTSNYLRTTAGGLSMMSSFYMGCVGRLLGSLGNYQHFICYGDDASNHRHAMTYYSTTLTGTVSFNGTGADVVHGLPVETTNSAHFWEIIYNGTSFNICRDGVVTAAGYSSNPLVASASDPITLGANNSGTEWLNGDIAEVLLLSSVPSYQSQTSIRSYIANKYGLTIAAPTSLSGFSGGNAMGNVNVFDDNGQVSVGGAGVQTIKQHGNNAEMSINGSMAAFTVGSEHQISNSWALFNTLAIWNQHPSGYSAVRFLHSSGDEMAAAGYGYPGATPWGGPNGSFYLETSNFHDGTKWGDFRIVQTKSGSGAHLRFRLRDDSNAVEVYDLSEAEPGANNPAAGLVMQNAKPVTAVASNGTLNTNITTPAYGLLIVKDTTNSKCAVYTVQNTTLTVVNADVEFSTASGNPSTVNVYNSSGQIQIQNNTGGSLNLTAAYYGA